MKKTLNKLAYYLALPAIIIVGLILVLFWQLNDFERSVNIAATIIQSMAILVGALWAYHKFDWGKRAESAIKLKEMLMRYEALHNDAAGQYRLDQQSKKGWLKCWANYAMRMIPARNEFADQIHLSCYVPAKLRNRLFDVVFLSINKGKSPKTENLDKNWGEFGKELKKAKKELDDLISK